jgi:hypothetical protein
MLLDAMAPTGASVETGASPAFFSWRMPEARMMPLLSNPTAFQRMAMPSEVAISPECATLAGRLVEYHSKLIEVDIFNCRGTFSAFSALDPPDGRRFVFFVFSGDTWDFVRVSNDSSRDSLVRETVLATESGATVVSPTPRAIAAAAAVAANLSEMPCFPTSVGFLSFGVHPSG